MKSSPHNDFIGGSTTQYDLGFFQGSLIMGLGQVTVSVGVYLKRTICSRRFED